MGYDAKKFKTLVHYICWRCNDPSKLGSVKLNKILWSSDLAFYYRNGVPLTGARYVKRQYGPVPSAIVPILRELESEGAISINEVPFFDYKKREFVVKKEPNLSLLSQEERALVDDAIALICNEYTARSVSEATHDHIWRAAQDGEEIPYYTVFAEPGILTQDEIEWANEILEHMSA